MQRQKSPAHTLLAHCHRSESSRDHNYVCKWCLQVASDSLYGRRAEMPNDTGALFVKNLHSAVLQLFRCLSQHQPTTGCRFFCIHACSSHSCSLTPSTRSRDGVSAVCAGVWTLDPDGALVTVTEALLQGKEKKKWEPPPPPPRVGRKQRRAAAAGLGSKLPTVTPSAKCKLRLLKLERIKDWLLMEEVCTIDFDRPDDCLYLCSRELGCLSPSRLTQSDVTEAMFALQEFLANQERLRPQEERNQEDRDKVCILCWYIRHNC